MIDTTVEQLIPLRKAARVINPAKPAHVSTIWRWSLYGVRGQRLESIVLGGVRHTSREACQRFVQALNSPGAVSPAPDRRAERAEAELVRRGC
ncbi:MAG: DUF1580 domain-containing protein [Phycisphaerae bacterium]|jgi:hypothetical protein